MCVYRTTLVNLFYFVTDAPTKLPQADQPPYHSFSDTSSDSLLDRYPYSDPYTPRGHDTHLHHPPPYNPPSFDPFQDPRAQLIISQAMQQLSRLATGNPPGSAAPQHSYNQQPQGERRPPAYQQPPHFQYQNPQWEPYTPTHHSHQSYGSSSSHSTERHSLSVNSTPSRPHPYPYSFAPSSSGGTFPPSSPEPLSSPPRFVAEPSTSHRRATSLVRRSQSRGRRVSFRLEGEEFVAGGSLSAPSSEDENSRNGLDRRAVVKHGGTKSRQGPGEVKASSSRSSVSRDTRQERPSQEWSKRNKSPHVEHSPMQSQSKSKGKARADLRHNGRVYSSEESEVESYSPPATTRGTFVRGQTPGPPSHLVSPRSSSRSRSVVRREKASSSKSVRRSS
jgi:hypothetical protein